MNATSWPRLAVLLAFVLIPIAMSACGGGGDCYGLSSNPTINTTEAAVLKAGDAWSGEEVHFTAVIDMLAPDDTGAIAAADIHVPATSDYGMQISLPTGTDISKLAPNDVIEVWGTDGGLVDARNSDGVPIKIVHVDTDHLIDGTYTIALKPC